MGSSYTIPVTGLVLALLTGIIMLYLGMDPLLTIAVLIVWVGTVFIAGLRPPELPSVIVEEPLERDMMRRLIENAASPLMVTEKGTIAIANRAARRILGQHIIGQDARVAFRQPEAIRLLNKNRNGKAIVRGLVRRQDIWQFNRHTVDEQLAVIELINQTAEADMSRAHTDFVANASHELRTPLASILGYVETLSDSSDSLGSPTSRKFLGTIEREAKRLQSLISDLMSLSRVEAEKHDVPLDMIDLNALIEKAAQDAAASRSEDRVEIDLQFKAQVKGDQQQLEQVVRNLVDNALKYGSPNTPVSVKLSETPGGQARIDVADQGEGIAPEQIPHLTRRFYRTDPGRSRASGGTGLGLAIVKHIVERHRGRLEIESVVNEGTRVTVRLPTTDQDLDTESEDGSEATASSAFQDESSLQPAPYKGVS